MCQQGKAVTAAYAFYESHAKSSEQPLVSNFIRNLKPALQAGMRSPVRQLLGLLTLLRSDLCKQCKENYKESRSRMALASQSSEIT